MMQSEQRRHRYLEALGIPSWLPRAPLPGARPSPDWVWRFRQGESPNDDGDFVDDAGDSAPAMAPPSPRRASQPAGADRAALLDSLGAEAEPRTPSPPAPEAAPRVPTRPAEAAAVVEASPAVPLAPIEPQPIPEFKLAFLRLSDALLIDALPPQSRGGLTAAHQRLAMALVRALGQAADEAPEVQILPWPAFTSRSLDQGREQAEAAVQRKLDHLLEPSPARFVLLLGEAAAQLVLRSRETGEGMRGVLFRPRSQLPALATASLSEMLQVPGCKREVWRDLQPLIRQLDDG